MFQNSERELNPRNRRGKLVRDIAKESLLAMNESCEPTSHAIDRNRKLPDFIAAVFGEMIFEIALRDAAGVYSDA